jgi:hypothetical protein
VLRDQRMSGSPVYPFEPHSNTHLEPGQFWGIPLTDGAFACGRVLAIPSRADHDRHFSYSTTTFLAGLMAWVAREPPTSRTIADAHLLAQGKAHILTIRRSGGILGSRDLGLDGITGLREVTHRGDGTLWLYEGARRLRSATREEAQTLPITSTWGYGAIAAIAESRFVPGAAGE